MPRINTNISSLNAQKSLARSNMQLQQALTRLSTGIRINVGKDDPAGLIASEVLRSDITSVQQAITNSERANQMIATADSAMRQISSLLNDVRGLISEAANEGAMSADQIAANQMQVDSSLEAIDRIVQVTQFQGKRLLDGNMGFVTENVDSTKLSDLEIQQAVFGTSSQISVGIEVVSQAEQASLTFQATQVTSNVVVQVGGYDGFEAFSFGAGSSVTEMRDAINLVSDVLGVEASLADRVAQADSQGIAYAMNVGGTNGFSAERATAGQYEGDFTINYLKDATLAGNPTAKWNAGSPNVIEVTVDTDAAAITTSLGAIAGVLGASTATLTPKAAGASFNGAQLRFTAAALDVYFDYNTGILEVSAPLTTTGTAIKALVDGAVGDLFTIAFGTSGNTLVAGDLGLHGPFTHATNGIDGGALDATNVDIDKVVAAIDALGAGGGAFVDATTIAGGGQLPDIITHSGAIGEVNAGGTDDPNNRIQLTTADDVAANLPITFAASGVSQAFSIDYTNNTRTDGKSTAYIQGTGTGFGILKIESDNMGSEYDGITFRIVHDAAKKSVVWDKEGKAITVYANIGTADATVTNVAQRINDFVGDDFTASAEFDGGNNSFVTLDAGTTEDGARYDAITVNLATDANGVVTTTAAEVVTNINNAAAMADMKITASHVYTSDGSGLAATGALTLSEMGMTAADGYATGTTVAEAGNMGSINVAARTAGAAYNNVKVLVVEDAAALADVYASYNATDKELTLHVQAAGATTAAEFVNNYNTTSETAQSVKDLFTLTTNGGGGGGVNSGDVGWLRDGVTYSGTSQGGLDSEGNYDEGDVVGTGGLEFTSIAYGSKRFVEVKAISGTFATVDADGDTVTRDYGADANVRINGIEALADGLDISLNTATLDLSLMLASTFTAGTSTSFQIASGGAQFQLGPDVVSNQQARIGIQAMSTSLLGGATGRLYQLRSGGTFALDTDTGSAAKVVEEVITKVSSLRGRLGAFQMTTLDANIATLNDTLESLTEAESSIRDADFAAESANLTRAQILVQSGISVLAIANSNPQSILALLR